jgi:hypothetical protein
MNQAHLGLISAEAIRNGIESARLLDVAEDAETGMIVCRFATPGSYVAEQFQHRYGALVRRALAKALAVADGRVVIEVGALARDVGQAQTVESIDNHKTASA